MKAIIQLTIAAIVLGHVASAATSQKLLGEMEDYIRDLIRAHPEVVGEKKKKKYREEMVEQARREGIYELSEAQEKNLRRNKEVVKDNDFATTLKQMKSLNSEDPKVTFLLKYAQQDRIKSVEKLLAYRLMKRDYGKAAQKAADARAKRMKVILTKYTDYKTANNKPPADLATLDLPEDCKQFVNSKGEKVDWIYFGHLGPQLKTDSSHIVLVCPEPLGDARTCGLDNGEVVHFKNSSIEKQINKVLEAIKNGTIQPSAGGASAGGAQAALAAIMKRLKVYQELNNGKLPDALSDLKVAPEHLNYTDPATGKKSPWIYLGSNSPLRVNDKVKVLVVAPQPHQGRRLAGLSDGKIGALDDKQIAPALNK